MINACLSRSPWPRSSRTPLFLRPVPGGELRSIIADALPHHWSLMAACALMLLQGGVSLTVPWLAGQLTLTLLGEAGSVFPASDWIFGLMVLVFACQALLSIGTANILARAGEHVVSSLRIRLHDHLQSLPLAYHHERRRGDVLSLLTRDVDIIGGYITGTLVAVVPMALTFLGAWILMLGIDWSLACLAGALVPVFIVTAKLLARRIRPLSRELSEAQADTISAADENLALLPVVKAFTRERESAERYAAGSRRVVALGRRLQLILGTLQPIMAFLAASGMVLLLWLASTALPPDALVSFFLYGLLLARPMSGLAATWGDTQHARASMERLNEVFAVQPEPLAMDAHALPRVKGAIEFAGVSFGYGDRGLVIEDLDLTIAAGETVALIGANGAGKSSLVGLLLRFFDPRAGRVRIDGTDISHVSLRSLREQIGLVPQNILLLNGTIRDNIAFGSREPDLSRVRIAAELACANDFIRSLPDGYDTPIGERGLKLSGGQQQRIALARALYKDPPILVLDEATAMFDPEGESSFLARARDVFADRTVVLITHQAASLAVADRVLRLDGGRVIPWAPARPGGSPRDS